MFLWSSLSSPHHPHFTSHLFTSRLRVKPTSFGKGHGIRKSREKNSDVKVLDNFGSRRKVGDRCRRKVFLELLSTQTTLLVSEYKERSLHRILTLCMVVNYSTPNSPVVTPPTNKEETVVSFSRSSTEVHLPSTMTSN